MESTVEPWLFIGAVSTHRRSLRLNRLVNNIHGFVSGVVVFTGKRIADLQSSQIGEDQVYQLVDRRCFRFHE